jgi:subtilisin-like proprotein convertase family protein
VGDPFDVDFVSHEIGHHFGARHSYNGGQGSCGGQRSPSTAVEPGSGTTIMAYAGICSGDNVQPNSDDHFHSISIGEMWARITSTTQPTCSSNTPNGNSAPIAMAGQDYTIPFGTAFTLTGTGSDPDGDTISYCWEQIDTGTNTNQPNTSSTDNPNFRSLSPTTNPARTFPQLSAVLNDNLTPQWEVIPSVARAMDFSLTVRDNQSLNGGQTNRDDMRVTTANTGPFVVTSPSTTNESFPSGSTHTITWDVAGTDSNGINTSNVNILLSTDGGQNFNTVLASNTPNDGSETIIFPVLNEAFCRVKIEPVGNIYFAMSKSFSIGANVVVSEVCNTYNSAIANTPIPDNRNNTSIPITVSETTLITDLRVSANVTHPFVGDIFLQLQDPNDNFVNVWNFNCGNFQDISATFKDGEPAIQCANPTAGTFAPAFSMARFNGTNPSGLWRMFAVDRQAGNVGVFNSWSIELCSIQTIITLDNEVFELDDFTLFPNPNKGEFNLQFNSNSGKSITINVYDISGKLVYAKAYDSTARFNEKISLNNASSGLYIIKVSDTDKTITKKLVID